ncbi:MAG TPA: cytochrome b/b6 domain-containing protein [Ramlibacter sp.]|nr:cytochrome b/b6 domain-containing protein [Ramlibacter sp.]
MTSTFSPDAVPASGTPLRAATTRGRLVIDAPTRMFHWLFALGFTGAYLTADSEHWMGTYQEWSTGEWLEEVHEFFGNAMLALVLGHLALVTLLSVLRKRNQATPMLTGRMPGNGRTWCAATAPGWRRCFSWAWWAMAHGNGSSPPRDSWAAPR